MNNYYTKIIIQNNEVSETFKSIGDMIGTFNKSNIILELCEDFKKCPYDLISLMNNAKTNFRTVNSVNGGSWLCIGNPADKKFLLNMNKKASDAFYKVSNLVGLKSGMLVSYLVDTYLLER
tara:strand:+ start:918 stop:1280 length:363 start_codon:yes stop_codon:yes gene_type:complete